MMIDDRIRRLVIFAILMENGEGILRKSKSYIDEKYYQAMNVTFPRELLDVGNKRKFDRWVETWEA